MKSPSSVRRNPTRVRPIVAVIPAAALGALDLARPNDCKVSSIVRAAPRSQPIAAALLTLTPSLRSSASAKGLGVLTFRPTSSTRPKDARMTRSSASACRIEWPLAGTALDTPAKPH